MRLLSLELERYGAFTGRRLVFRPDARLHVVLGPNEAGKSSALAAVTDLLFGIEERTRYDFLHREEGLRLGAEIVARDGRRLAFFRRKGRKNLLSDAAGAAIPDDALGAFLGGMTRGVFCNAFGMNASVLRRGAEEMLKSDGEVGASLFAAASGLRGYRDLARALDEDAAQIHAPRAQKRTLSLAIEAYESARKAAGAERLGADAWRKLLGELDEAEARLGAISARRRAAVGEAVSLRRLRAAAPALAVIDVLEADQAAFGDLVAMDEADVGELAACRHARDAAHERLAAAELARARARLDLSEVALDEAVGPYQAAILGLVEGLADYEKSVLQLPRVAREADEFEQDLAGLASRLGLPDAAAVEAGQPSDAARAGLKTLVARGRAIAGEIARIARDLGPQRQALAAQVRARDERGPLVDPAPPRRRYAALEPALREIGRRDALAAEIAREARALDQDAGRLMPPVGSAERLADLALPSDETIRRFAEHAAAVSRRRDRAREDGEAARQALEEDRARMTARGEGGAVPDPADVARARQERDAAWPAIRAAALGEPGAVAGAALLAGLAAYERALASADLMADRLAAGAGRAAEHAGDARRMRVHEADMARAEADLAEAEGDAAPAGREWIELWRPSGVAPLPAAEMAAWRAAAAALVQRHAALAAKQVDLAGIVERLAGVKMPLLALADAIGSSGVAGLDVSLLAQDVEARLDALAAGWDAARDAVARIAAAEAAIAADEAELADLTAREAAWRRDWDAALRKLSLPAATGLEGMEAALEAWSEVPGTLRERANRLGRVAGIRRDIDRYEAEVWRVHAAVSPDCDPTVTEAVRSLQARAQSARDAGILHAARASALRIAARAHDEARDLAATADRALCEILARHAVPDGTDLVALSARLEARARLRAETRRARKELRRAADGVAEADLRAELEAAGLDAIEGRLAALQAEEEALDHAGRVAFAERERLESERRRVEGGTGAELAAAAKSAAEVEIRAAARRYVVLRLGAMLLGAAVERHRAGQQDPLLARAGELFAGLTGGAFAALGQDYDDRDQPVLKGRRASGGRPVGVDEMSEGTRDQLFLALRLAYLEDFARRSEPAPFVGDDIFASFDDLRTGHGLEALAAIGHEVQPILFTHHASVVELATRRLGAAVDVIELA